MKRPSPKYEQMEVPRLHPEIKEMNGQSTKRLAECIDRLSGLLDENNKIQNEEADNKPQDLANPDTE